MKRLVAGFGMALVMVLALPPGALSELGDHPGGRGAPVASMTVTKPAAWDHITLGSFKLVNNQWGAPSNGTLTSGIYSDPDGGFGWYWSRLNSRPAAGAAYVKPLYPSVRIGGNPWEASGSSRFPLRVGDIKSLIFDVSYGYPASPAGTHNLAWDVFLTPGNQPASKPAIKAEVMVWLHGNARQPARSYKGDFSDGRNVYKLYSWVMTGGRAYYAFVLKGQSGQSAVTVDARSLLAGISLDPGLYIHGVELGNEVWDGTGRIRIDSLSVAVNGVPA